MFYTIYKTTNLVNNRFYIGKHQTKNPNDSYLGSGLELQRAILKYGKANFRKDVLHIFQTEDQMNNKEIELVTEELCNDPLSYNIRLGGEGGWNYVHRNSLANPKKGNEHRNVRMKELLADPEYYSKFCNKKRMDRLAYLARGNESTFKGRTHSNDTKEKLRNLNSSRNKERSQKRVGTKVYNNGSRLKYLTENEIHSHILDGWVKGRIKAG